MAVSKTARTAKNAEQIARSRYDGNPAGERVNGYLVRHMYWVGRKLRKHLARFTTDLNCSVCGGAL